MIRWVALLKMTLVSMIAGGGLVACSRAPDPATDSQGGPPASAMAFKKEYRMQVNVGPETYWGMGAARFADLARTKTGGRINIKPYYGSQLLKGAQLNSAQMVASGAIDAAFESTINTTPAIPEMNIFALPFFVRGYEDLDRLEQGATGKLIYQAMEKKGLQPLAWGENGFRQLTNARRPVRTPADLKQLIVRVPGDPIFIATFRAMGADPVNMNWGDAVTAFQQQTVDGQENPAAILITVRIAQFHKYATWWNYLADPLIIYWCKQEWDKFPADVQEALRAAATDAAAFEKALVRAGLDGEVSLRRLQQEFQFTPAVTNPVAQLQAEGMEIHVLTPDEQAQFHAVTQPIRDQWSKELGAVYEAARQDLGR